MHYQVRSEVADVSRDVLRQAGAKDEGAQGAGAQEIENANANGMQMGMQMQMRMQMRMPPLRGSWKRICSCPPRCRSGCERLPRTS